MISLAKRRGNQEGSIYKTQEGKWRAQVSIGKNDLGKPRYKYKLFSTQKAANNWIKEYRFENGIISGTEYGNIPLELVITKWFREKVGDQEHKPATIDRNASTINANIMPFIGGYKLCNITSDILQEQVLERMKRKNLSYSSIKKAYDLLNEVFRYAVCNGYLVNNPMMKVKKPKQAINSQPKIKIYSDEEIELIKQACYWKDETNNRMRFILGPFFVFILNTGIRLGEALDLKWTDIDFVNGIVTINSNCSTAVDRSTSSMKRVRQSVTPKSKAGYRSISINDNAYQALFTIQNTRFFGNNSYIASNKDGNQNTEANLRRMFKEICEFAGVEGRGIHALRHTFATKLFENNVDAKTISAVLGHSSIATTFDIYVEASKKQIARAVKITNI